MEPKVNFVLIGLFVVLLSVGLVGVVLWLGKGFERGTYDGYYAYMEESVSGLSVDASVKYRGVDVGRVKGIELTPDNPEQVRLTLEIVRGTPIKEDTVAILDVQGLTGIAIVDLRGGTRESPPLGVKPGEEYPVIQTGPSLLVRFDRAATRLLTNMNSVAENIDSLLEEKNRVTIGQLLTDMAAVTNTLAGQGKQFDRGMSHAVQTLENLARVTRKMNKQIPALIERMNRSAEAVEGMSQEVARTSKELSTVIGETKPNIERFSRQTLTETSFLVTELRELTATLQRLAQQLEQEPSSLVFGRSAQPIGPGE
jgi:phospholipid/cholesterol/gamma-HCH transport system substrate-binding protein